MKNILQKSFPAFFLMCLMLVSMNGWGQTNPAPHSLSTSDFSFIEFASGTTTTYPTSMQGWRFASERTLVNFTDAATADRVLVVSTDGIATGSIRNEVANGISLLNSGTNNHIGAIVVALNCTSRNNVKVSWVAQQLNSGESGATDRINGLRLQYRIGTSGSFTNVASTEYLTTNTTSQNAAQTFTDISLPADVNNEAVVQIRWVYYISAGTANGRDRIRLDNISVTSTAAAATPTITGAATATAFTTTYGTASTAQSFAVSGANLTANLVASAPTGFEVSNDGVTYGASASFTQTSGSASGTLTIRLAATAPVAGTYNSQNIVLSSTGATSVNISTPASGNSVSPKELTITGLVSQDKIYNGTTAVTVTGTLAYAGLVNGDTPTPPTVGTWTFSDANAGNNKILTRSVAYTNPTNYTVTQPSLTASITTKELTITGLTAQDKPFDGNTNVTVTGTPTYVGLENGESFTVTGTVNWAFPDATEGIDKVLVRTGSYNAPSANYTVNQPSLTASITAAGTPSLTVSEIASENTLNGDVVLLTLLNVEFADTNLSASNFTLNNAPAGLTVASVAHTSPTTANLTFAYDNTDFDANITNFTITIVGAELTPSANLTSAPITILAETETLNVAGTLAFGNQCTGQTSTAQSFTISGTNLKNANISLAAFTGYTYSETVDGTYTSTLSFAHAGGNLASKTIFVRFTPNALSAFNGNIVVTSLGAPNENQAVTGSGVNTPPTVTSPTSASITANAATLGGNITVVGCNTITTRGVEYSTTNGFENGTGTQVVENGSFSTGTFTANVTGLASSTTYYYKAFATSLSGTAYTTQGTFTTSLISTPVATAATAINSSGFTANWNAVAGATSYEIDVYTEGSYNLFSENFTNFNGSGFSPSPSDGQLDSDFWKITGLSDGDTTFGSSSITGDYAKGSSDIEVTSGGIYSFITVSNNNVLGIQPTGDDWTPGSIVLKLTNTSNSTLSSLSITYKIYVRNDQGRSSSFNFSHSSNDSVYTDVTALNYTSPTTADALGWIVVNRTIDLSGLSIPVNGSYFLRWSGNDVGGSSSRDEFGLDDVVVTSSVINNILQNQDVGNVTSYVVTGLDPETEYFYVVRAKEGTNSESLNSNEITVPTTAVITWNGTVWSNSNVGPTINDDAVINGDYTSAGNLSAKNLTIAPTGSFTVSTGHTLTLSGALTNNATAADFVVSNNANFIQTTNATNSGQITVVRESAPIKRLDVTMWSTPVAGQNLKQLSPATLNNRFLEYDSENSTYVIINPLTTTMVPAKGYSVRAPNNWSATVASAFTGSFVGVPNNGLYTVNVAPAGSRFYLVGNPYPSSLSLNDLYNGGNNHIGSTFHLYEHTIGIGVTGNNFATYNVSGNVYLTADRVSGSIPVQPDFDGNVKAGQGFFVEASAGAGTISFQNTMRNSTVNNFFFRTNNEIQNNNADSFKLNLMTPTTVSSQIALGFFEGATSDLETFDSKSFASEPLFYSLLNSNKMAIQAKAWPMNAGEVFPLGFNAIEAGEYTISLSEVTESFENSQLVFIHDQLTNTYHNLGEADYTFISEEGTFDNRLVVVFTSILSNDNPIQTNTNVWVYKRGNQWTASVAGNTTIESVMVYDLQGRTLYEAKALQTNQHNIKNLMDANAIFIVHVVTADGKTHIIKTAN